jgi:Tfp pilus assembly protein PilF
LEPDDVVANTNFGRMLQKKGDIKLARTYLERALFLDPEYGAARSLLDQMGDD